MKSPARFFYFLVVMIAVACGSPLRPMEKSEKRASNESPRRVVRLEYAATVEPYLDEKGTLMIPGQKLERWSGKTFVGSSGFDVVPID